MNPNPPPASLPPANPPAPCAGELPPASGPVRIVDYDPQWPVLLVREAARIAAALGDRLQLLEHVGSTAVPGLPAKPVLDLVLAVADSAAEAAYVPAVTAAGYRLRIREPHWHEPRLFHGPDTRVNLHVFSLGCTEINRMLDFRDWLRRDPADRALYARTKLDLARRPWPSIQHYADAKTGVVEEILGRARRAAGGENPSSLTPP